MAESLRIGWITLLIVFFANISQNISQDKDLKITTFDCEMTIQDVKWTMECESENFVDESSTNRFYVAKLHGELDPIFPVVYDDILLSTSWKESEFLSCESELRYFRTIDPSVLSRDCQKCNKLIRKLIRVLNETSLSSIEISRAREIKYLLNILQQPIPFKRIVLTDHFLPYISSLPIYSNNSVKFLELERNEIKNFSGNVFRGFPTLELLDLSHNQLQSVYIGMFSKLNTLLDLDLSFNIIESISEGAFADLVSLKRITLRNNNLRHIRADLFGTTNHLNVLDISNNRLEILPPALFLNLQNLKNLSCSNCSLRELDKDLFGSSPNIYHLNLNSNLLKAIPEDSFNELQFIRGIDLSNNKISFLSENLFKSKDYLLQLNVSRNEIESMGSGIFSGAPNIHYLDLSYNKIKLLKDEHVSNFSDLELFSLKSNHLKSVVIGQTENEVNIRFLDISDNLIRKLNVGWKRLRIMETFLASNNQLTSLDLPPCIFSVKKTLTFSFHHNNISTVNAEALIADQERVEVDNNFAADCSFNGHEQNYVDLTYNPLICDCNLYPFYQYLKNKSPRKIAKFLSESEITCEGPKYISNTSLVSLSGDLLSCQLKEECPSSCFCGVRGNDNLRFLNCSSGNLKEVPQAIPNGIFVLYFNNNRLKSMTSLNGGSWKKLRELHLDNNLLETLGGWNFPESLDYLSVKGNKLKTLPTPLIKFIESRSKFDLFFGYNDENCGCDRVHFKSFLIESKFVRDNEDILCVVKNNGSSAFLPLTAVPDNNLCPEKSVVVYYSPKKLVISLCAVFSFLLSLLLVYYRQRQLILSFLYIHFEDFFRLFYTEEDYDENMFDAFVAYSSDDRDLVMELMEELESNPPYFRLCIHERNWLPGQFIAENIINSVHGSRRTIVVLSTSFIASPWFNLELRAAVFKMSKDKKNRIIIILAEKSVSLDNIDSELKHVISKRTYLVWGERWFWEKLRYAMPRKRRSKEESRDVQIVRSTSELSLVSGST